MSTWLDLLRNDPTPADEEVIGLLGVPDAMTAMEHGYYPPVASRLHFVTCDGVSQVHAELTLGSRTVSFYMNTLDAREALHSLASTTDVSDALLDALDKETAR